MAIAGLNDAAYEDVEAADEGAEHVRLAVHDATRLEWSLSIPLPRQGAQAYDFRIEIEVPSSAFVRHDPWNQMQAFTRLDGPAFATADDVSIDALRRAALAMASQLQRASDGFTRHCRLAASLFATATHSDLEDALTIWIAAALRIAGEARARLALPTQSEPVELSRERALVDEYISVRLLDMLAGAERAIAVVCDAKSANEPHVAAAAAAASTRIADALGRELDYRAGRGFMNADPRSPEALERYLDRSSRLKKHFQELLFLENETFQIAERAYHWVAGFVALIASTWAFAWQIALASQASAKTVSSGLLTLAVMAGLVYATKDRIKEVGRTWVTRRVQGVWGAQRVTRYRAPRRRLAGRDIIVTARESFEQTARSLEDTLNPECGATQVATVLAYTQRGEVLANAALGKSGVRRVKHVFRYDLSPLFARLDDATKPVPVLEGDGESRRVRFIDAPRCYRLPIRIELTSGSGKRVRHATLVLHKRGLERLERQVEPMMMAGPISEPSLACAEAGPVSEPSLPEIGIEPG